MELPFPAALALAGAAYLLGHVFVRIFPTLERHYVPEPIVGGLAIALGLAGLRAADVVVEFPKSGLPLDVLVATLTVNMGLHVTPSVLRQGLPLLVAFTAFGVVLAVCQFGLALPFAWLGEAPLHTAFLAGPLSLVGAPFNLNPPDQTAPLESLYASLITDLEPLAQGSMMIGVLSGVVLGAVLGRRLERRAGTRPPVRARKDEGVPDSAADLAEHLATMTATILLIIAAAIALQDVLLAAIPAARTDHLPMTLIAYLIAVVVRLAVEAVRPGRFPDQALTVLLLGPTMGLVFGYTLMSLPLHRMANLSVPVALGTVAGVGGSLAVAWVGYGVFARLTNRYYAAVVATAFLAVTTAWGPVGMSYLRFFIREEGEVEPMPVVLPLNAFYLFPWTVIVLGHLIL